MTFLDYASTNPWPKYRCADYYGPLFNVNANYAFAEKRMLDEAGERIKTSIGAKNGKVVFGGTSSQLIENLFTHIAEETSHYLTICSVYEHESVWRFADQWGNLDSLTHVIQTYSSDRQLIVCLMGVNNVTGHVFPVEEIGRLCKKHGAFFVCDMTAMIGHAHIPANTDEWCDCVIQSSHKIGTELGIGCMWLSNRFNDWLGDFKLRGTPNLAGAMAIADATDDAVANVKQNVGRWVDLYCYLKRELEENGIEYSNVIGDVKWGEWTPAINAIRLHGINARALQSYLASKQVYIGIGASSCAEENDFRVLNSFRLTDEDAAEVIRISFGADSTGEDVKTLVHWIAQFAKEYV